MGQIKKTQLRGEVNLCESDEPKKLETLLESSEGSANPYPPLEESDSESVI